MSKSDTRGISPERRRVLAIVLITFLMIVLDVSIVITALPKIQNTLGFTATGLSWIQGIYTLVFGGLMLLGARAGDLLGRRKVFLAGLAAFSISSLLVAVAQSPAWLIGARALQGVGAAVLAPTTLALIATHFPEGPERSRAMAYFSAVAGAGASVGLIVGGFFAQWLSWRTGFFINMPIGAVLMLASLRYIPETGSQSGRFDLFGAFSSTLGMFALVFGTLRAADAGWSDPTTVVSFVAGAVVLAIFVLHESRTEQPIMPLRVFASSERSAAYVTRLLFFSAVMSFWFLATQYVQRVLGLTPFEAGLAFVPTTAANFAVAMNVPRLSERFGNERVMIGGLLSSVVGMGWFAATAMSAPSVWHFVAPMLLIGIGDGACLSRLTMAGVSGVLPEDTGAASGVVSVADSLGGSLGLAALMVVFTVAGARAATPIEALTTGVSASLFAATGLLALGLVVAYLFIVRTANAAHRTAAQTAEEIALGKAA